LFHESAEVQEDVSVVEWGEAWTVEGMRQGNGGEGRTRVGYLTKGAGEPESLLRISFVKGLITQNVYFFCFCLGCGTIGEESGHVVVDGSIRTWLFVFLIYTLVFTISLAIKNEEKALRVIHPRCYSVPYFDCCSLLSNLKFGSIRLRKLD